MGLWESFHHRAWDKTVRPRLLRAGQAVGSAALRVEVRHLFGPAKPEVRPHELIVTCLVRNGALHVRSFIEHHRALGIRHIVFLDNGSTDETVDLIREYDGVTVLRTRLPYRWLENQMKEFLSRRFSSGRWNLCLDVDELWHYPCAADRSLAEFLGYLDANGFDTAVCQMLDMFSDLPFSALDSRAEDDLKRKYPFHDLGDVERGPYPYGDPVPPDVQMHYGGVRKRVFGTRNWLTKAALVRVSPEMRLFVDTHFNTPARVADVTCLLMHFPFVDRFPAKVEEAVADRRYLQSAQHEYLAYQQTLSRPSELTLTGPDTARFTTPESLLDQGFLVASNRFRGWALDS
ncbi:hypothetical protein BH23GEM11_BH23GEM11_04100 [soil metagenome]